MIHEPVDMFSPKYYEAVRRPLNLAETLPGSLDSTRPVCLP